MFKFDPNSGPNEGRWRQTDPKRFNMFWRVDDPRDVPLLENKTSLRKAKGIVYLLAYKRYSKKPVEIQAIRFKRRYWTETRARKWWRKHRKKFKKTWTEQDWLKWMKKNKKTVEDWKFARTRRDYD